MSSKYKIRDQDKLYFITTSVVQWVDVFTRPVYKDIIVESLVYCQVNKGLEIYAWCIMTNHIHLIVGRNGDSSIEDIIRDFKKFTSVKICREIENNLKESRRDWLLWIFKRTAEKSNKHQKYQFWQRDFHPIELNTNHLMDQKLQYIHNNPVKAGIVNEPEDYRYSSAIDYSGGRGMLTLKYIG